MATVTGGIISTGNVLAARLVADVSDKIHLLESDKISLTKLMSRLPKREAGQPTVNWQTDELAPKADTLNEALDTTEVDIDVSNGSYWKPNDVLKVTTTGETMIVQSVSSNTITVVARSNGAIAGTAASSGDAIINMGSAFAEGAGLRISASDDTIISKYVQTVMKANYTQIFRRALALSRTEMQSKLYGGKDRPYQRRKVMIEHCRDINHSLYFGEAADGTGGTRRTMGGVLEFIPSGNLFNTAALTESQFNSDLETGFRYGSDRKALMTSRFVNGVMSEWASVVQRVSPEENKFGVRITRYVSPHGDVDIIPDVTLEGATYKKYAVLLDLAELALRPLQDTVLLVDRQIPDVDGVVDEYLTETSAEWGHGSYHAYWNSITS